MAAPRPAATQERARHGSVVCAHDIRPLMTCYSPFWQHAFLAEDAIFGDLAPAALAQKHVAVGLLSAMDDASSYRSLMSSIFDPRRAGGGQCHRVQLLDGGYQENIRCCLGLATSLDACYDRGGLFRLKNGFLPMGLLNPKSSEVGPFLWMILVVFRGCVFFFFIRKVFYFSTNQRC